jgi:hypothetical protein
MASGGARTKSGPAPDPNSRESARRGLTFKLLPLGGFAGPVPDFPLPEPTVRELEVWGELWRTPQAAMWDSEGWQTSIVGLYCRTRVRSEAFDAPSGVLGHLHRLGDQIGMTPAGMTYNGWRLTPAKSAAAVEDLPAAVPDAPAPAARPARRLRAVEDAPF